MLNGLRRADADVSVVAVVVRRPGDVPHAPDPEGVVEPGRCVSEPAASLPLAPPTSEPRGPRPTDGLRQPAPTTRPPAAPPQHEVPDWAYAEPFQFTAQELGGGKKLYNANVAIFQFQRAYNRLAQRIAAERPDLIARYQPRFEKPLPFALTVDGQLGPNSNNAKMLLQEYLGFTANETEFTAEHWAALRQATEGATRQRWVNLGFQTCEFLNPQQRNAARVIERLADEDPVTLMKLAVALGAPANTTYVGFTASGQMVRDLAARLAGMGIPMNDAMMGEMYVLDRTGRGGVTFMRARGLADLAIERDHITHDTQDALIQRAVTWIRAAEPSAFARFAQTTGAADPEVVLAALIKAVMSAESDFGRAQDYDASDVGLMQLTWMVAQDASLYMAEGANPPWGAEPPVIPEPFVTNGGVAVPSSFPRTALDPLRNTAAGGSLLVQLMNRFQGHLTFAAAAYNVGPNKRELNLPEGERRIPNLYATLAHSMRIQRRFPLYLAQMRARPV